MGGFVARFKLMFWTIVAPELVLAWGVRQWFAAREISNLYNQHRGNRPSKVWTMAHGHFLEMGGFTLVSDKINQLEEPEQPGWLSTTAEWDRHIEYVRQKKLYQLGTLTFGLFKELVGGPNVTFPAITAAQINDRSKGDGLSKLLAIIQTSWFIFQCVARGLEGLVLTELELVTLAMASLNAITFAFWWSKPLSVQEPVNVYVTKLGLTEEKDNRNSNTTVETIDDLVTTRDAITRSWYIFKSFFRIVFGIQPLLPRRYYVLHPFLLLYMLTFPVFLLLRLGTTFLLWAIKTEKVEQILADETVTTRVFLSIRKSRYNLTYSIVQYIRGRNSPLETPSMESNVFGYLSNWFLLLPSTFFLLLFLVVVLSPLLIFFVVASFIFTAAFEIVTTNRVRPGATHVPPFYAPRTKSDNYSRMIVFAIFGVIFGGIHCIAWNFSFPTRFEKSLWRYTSLILTAIPVVVAPIDCVLENLKFSGTVGERLQLFLGVFMTVLLFLYVPARLCLIVQALALLRDQPASAYVAVNWTKYIPHLFS